MSRTLGRGRRLWWLPLAGIGLVLLAVPFVALAVTNRAPDPLFTHAWWSPIACTPIEVLPVGTAGVALLVGVLLTGMASRLVRRRRAAVALIVAAGLTAGGFGLAAARGDASPAALRDVLAGTAPNASPQAIRAFRLALALPGAEGRPVGVVARSSLPAGPFIVQTTSVRHPDLGDEFAEVTVGALVDPLTGRVEAAWFFGL